MQHDETYDPQYEAECEQASNYNDYQTSIEKGYDYWKQRCLLAEKIKFENIYPVSHKDAIKAYNDFLSNNKEPK